MLSKSYILYPTYLVLTENKRRNKKMSEKVSIEQVYKEACRHCIHNPNAEKPYAKMKELPLTDLTRKLVEKHAEKHGLTPECWVCLSITRMMNMPFEELLAQLKKDHAKN
jgi:hypothetical protein